MRPSIYLCLALLCCLGGTGSLRAQDDEQQKPQEEIPDFSSIDEYIYVPKTTLNYGFRYVSGVKATFSGTGSIPLPSNISIGDATTPDSLRTYYDGSVGVDTRTITTNNGNGTTSQVPISGSDGKTNTWNYVSTSQVDPNGLMTFSTYQSRITDPLTHSSTGKGSFGTEVSASRDMGDFGKRFSWKLFAGVSVNDIQAGKSSSVSGTVTTTTDTYDLFGQTPPAAPYSAPSSTTINVVDSNGNQVNDSNGNPETQTNDTTTLIGNVPINRTTTTNVPTVLLSNRWQVHGAYLAFRAGPSLVWNISPRLHLSLDAGPALIYAGSDYEVIETFEAPTGPPQVQDLSNVKSKALIGYYGDATLQYDMSEHTGLYVGSYYQDSGKYDQTINNVNGNYTTHVDMNNQSGLRTGMTFKF
jgi:hypothetical protein